MKPNVKYAISLWQEFHQKDEPSEMIDISHPSGVFPKQWGFLGMAKTCYYRSDKWEEDGTTHDYYHPHGEVECWHPWRQVAGLTKGTPKVKWPSSLTYLGESLGWDVAVGGALHANRFFEPAKREKLILCAFPDRSALVVLDVSQKTWSPTKSIRALFYGPTLTVEDRGIVG